MLKSLADLTDSAFNHYTQTESPIERRMFSAFMRDKRFIIVPADQKDEGAGYFVLPQRQLGKYRADFILKAVGFSNNQRIWPPNSKVYIAVECDGQEFHTSKEQKEYDRQRDDFFMSKGIKTFRFTGSEVVNFSDRIVNDLYNILNNEVFK